MKKTQIMSSFLIAFAVLAMACSELTPTPKPKNCVTAPTECEFPINEAQAIEIARAAGMEVGTIPWQTNLAWHPGQASYIWSITTTPGQISEGSSTYGVLIDANTGEVISLSHVLAIPEDEGILLIQSTPEYRSLADKYGSDLVSVKAVNLHGNGETDFLAKISDGFLMEPGCIIVLKADGGEGYVYQLDEEFNIVFRMTFNGFEEGILNLDVRTMEHFYSSLQ